MDGVWTDVGLFVSELVLVSSRVVAVLFDVVDGC